MNNYNSFSLDSAARYKDVKSVSFNPLKEVKVSKKYSKGDWRFWKWLGLIPLIPYKAKEDLYSAFDEGVDGIHSLEYIKNRSWNRICWKNGKLYRVATVYVTYIVGNSKTEHFTSNEDAIKFIDELKLKCKEAENELK